MKNEESKTEERKEMESQACPMTASVNWDQSDDTLEQLEQWFVKFDTLPMFIRDGLSSEEIANGILRLAETFRVEDEGRVGEISRIVREFFTERLSQEQILKRIQEKMKLPVGQVRQFYNQLGKVIKSVQDVGKVKFNQSYERIAIIPALKKYPKLEKQEITNNYIISKRNGDENYPTVKNWIDDYIFNFGAQSHDNLIRTKYLFNSENTIGLSNIERSKVQKVIESYDEDKLLLIDREEQEIYFDPMEEYWERKKQEEKEKKWKEETLRKRERGEVKNKPIETRSLFATTKTTPTEGTTKEPLREKKDDLFVEMGRVDNKGDLVRKGILTTKSPFLEKKEWSNAQMQSNNVKRMAIENKMTSPAREEREKRELIQPPPRKEISQEELVAEKIRQASLISKNNKENKRKKHNTINPQNVIDLSNLDI